MKVGCGRSGGTDLRSEFPGINGGKPRRLKGMETLKIFYWV